MNLLDAPQAVRDLQEVDILLRTETDPARVEGLKALRAELVQGAGYSDIFKTLEEAPREIEYAVPGTPHRQALEQGRESLLEYSPLAKGLAEQTTETPVEDMWRLRASQALDVSPEQISFEDPLSAFFRPFLAQADTPEEREKMFKWVYPKGRMRAVDLSNIKKDPGLLDVLAGNTEYVYQTEAGDDKPWYFANVPGADIGDVAEYAAGPMAPALGELMAMGHPAMRTAGWVPKIVAGGIGGGIGHMAKQQMQTLAGIQSESRPDQLVGAAMEMLISGAGQGLFSLPAHAYDALRGAGKEGLKNLYEDAQKVFALRNLMQSKGQDIAAPPVTGLSPHPGARVVEQQSRATNELLDLTQQQMQEQAGQALESMRPGLTTTERASRVAGERAAQTLEKGRFGARTVTPEPGAVALKKAYAQVGQQLKQSEDVAWRGIDTAVERFGEPRFDITESQAALKDLLPKVPATQTTLEPVGFIHPTVEEVKNYVNVAQQPPGKLARLLHLYRSIDPIQTDWKVLKEIRTQIGDFINENSWEQQAKTGSGIAKEAWGAITEDLKAVGKDNPEFLKAFDDAVSASKAKWEVYNNPTYRTLENSEAKAAMVNEVWKSPDTILNADMRKILSAAPPESREMFKKASLQSVLATDDPVATLLKMKQLHPEGLEFLANGNRQTLRSIENAATQLKELRDSPVGRMAQGKTEAFNTLKGIVRDIETPRQVAQLRAGLGPKADWSLKTALLENIVEGALTWTKSGKASVKPMQLGPAIAHMKRVGLWDLFSPEERVRLEGLEAYARRFLGGIKDVGVSLQANSIFSKIKKPDTFVSGVHSLVNNRIIARAITYQWLTEAKLKRMATAPSRPPLPKTWFDLMAPAELMATRAFAELPTDPEEIKRLAYEE